MKYSLTNESILYKGAKLYRVRAAGDIGSNFDEPILVGTLGGWIESEKNLS